MGNFGAATPKRHRLWSNDEDLLNKIASRAGYMSRQQQGSFTTKTTRKYVDRRGVKRCVGIKKVLKESQNLSETNKNDFFFGWKPCMSLKLTLGLRFIVGPNRF